MIMNKHGFPLMVNYFALRPSYIRPSTAVLLDRSFRRQKNPSLVRVFVSRKRCCHVVNASHTYVPMYYLTSQNHKIQPMIMHTYP